MMELGFQRCVQNRNSHCATLCPVLKMCKAYQSGTVANYPGKTEKAGVQSPQYRIAVGVVFKNGRVLITRRKRIRTARRVVGISGRKDKKVKTLFEACIREIKEEVNLAIKVDSHLSRVQTRLHSF